MHSILPNKYQFSFNTHQLFVIEKVVLLKITLYGFSLSGAGALKLSPGSATLHRRQARRRSPQHRQGGPQRLVKTRSINM